ncbi:ribonuclease HI, partial [archaeon]|nr:ribonuclease HI [archaeon]
KRYYVVVRGRNPGIYEAWFGPEGARVQIDSFPGAVYKGFSSYEDALAYAGRPVRPGKSARKPQGTGSGSSPGNQDGDKETSPENTLLIYTDGGCISNPGPGGYGIVVIDGDLRKEISGGFKLTTNNRMELMAGIIGLKSVTGTNNKPVAVYSDSRYFVDGITKGWARRWRRNGWMRDNTHPAENIDLWAELLDLCEIHKPRFFWVKGHAGHSENERCDVLARQAALGDHLDRDLAYEKGETSKKVPSLF